MGGAIPRYGKWLDSLPVWSSGDAVVVYQGTADRILNPLCKIEGGTLRLLFGDANNNQVWSLDPYQGFVMVAHNRSSTEGAQAVIDGAGLEGITAERGVASWIASIETTQFKLVEA